MVLCGLNSICCRAGGCHTQCSRNIALIIYFTRDWKEEVRDTLPQHQSIYCDTTPTLMFCGSVQAVHVCVPEYQTSLRLRHLPHLGAHAHIRCFPASKCNAGIVQCAIN